MAEEENCQAPHAGTGHPQVVYVLQLLMLSSYDRVSLSAKMDCCSARNTGLEGGIIGRASLAAALQFIIVPSGPKAYEPINQIITKIAMPFPCDITII